MSDITYTTLSTQDRLNIAKDALRGKESDHFRSTLVGAQDYGGEAQVQRIADQITALRSEVQTLESIVEAETPAPDPIPEPTPVPGSDEQPVVTETTAKKS